MVLALDWGIKNTGVAVGEAGSATQLLPTISAPTRRQLVSEIDKVACQYGVVTVLLGLPRHRENRRKVLALKRELERLGYQVVLRGEEATSKLARDALSRQGHSAREIARRVHSASAELLLKEYLGE